MKEKEDERKINIELEIDKNWIKYLKYDHWWSFKGHWVLQRLLDFLYNHYSLYVERKRDRERKREREKDRDRLRERER